MVYNCLQLWYNYSIKSKKEAKMKGSIRILVGLLVTFGAVGGIDNATNGQLLPLVLIACAGLGMMYSGVNASKVY